MVLTPNRVITKTSSVFVSRTIKKTGGQGPQQDNQDGNEEIFGVHKFVTDPAHVGVTFALNINIGNYESSKISVTLTLPCYAEEIDDTYLFAQRWVEARLKDEQEKIVEWRNNNRRQNPF